MESEKARAKRLKDYYNLTIEKWEAMDTYQRSLCWLCGRRERTGKRLATDHSHLDGLVRGLLCSQCNPLLGKLENAFVRLGLHKVAGLTLIAIVEKLADYLKNPPATQALGQSVYGYAGRTGTKTHRKFLKRQAKAVTPAKPLLPLRKRAK
jgi:Recombination endonuclease VII